MKLRRHRVWIVMKSQFDSSRGSYSCQRIPFLVEAGKLEAGL
jgi:hypothetical protein